MHRHTVVVEPTAAVTSKVAQGSEFLFSVTVLCEFCASLFQEQFLVQVLWATTQHNLCVQLQAGAAKPERSC